MSYHTLSAKPLNKSMSVLLKRASHVGLGLGAFTPVLALANPTGAAVMTGQASITSPAANGLVIHQTSQSAIINWQQFNIGAGQYVQFLQPSTSSVVLNRVVGGSPTSIFGSLTANGQVFIVNTNGVFFGHGATIDAQGFLASSLDISDSNFLAKNYLFNKTGSDAKVGNQVVNQGSITAHRGGYVVLAGDYAENDGIISAQSGHVVLASGSKGTLTLNGNSLVSFAVNQATLAQYLDSSHTKTFAPGVSNTGQLLADGGTVIMTADVANALKATVVNNTGLVEARSINKNYGGIYLTADGGNLVNAGTLDADAMNAGHAGGNIVLKGDALTNLTNTSKITAQGIAADGGNVELSGDKLNVRGSATLGKGGHLLLDPTSVEIVTGSNGAGANLGTGSGETAQVGVNFIETQLNDKTNVAISAHNLIHASGGVTAITATTKGGGNLSFKTAGNGHIDLAGIDITIAGKLSANMGYGSFGHLQASSVGISASHGLELGRASANTHGVITKQSVLATKGQVTLTVGSNGIGSAEGGSGADGIAIKAKTDLNIHGNIHGNNNVTLAGQTIEDSSSIQTTGNIDITASSGDATLGKLIAGGSASVSAVGNTVSFIGSGASAHNNLTVTAHTISGRGTVKLAAGSGLTDNLTIKGTIDLTGSPHANLDLDAGGTVKLSGNVTAPGAITVDAGHLAYTGKAGKLTISAGVGTSAGGGDLTMDASIGSAAHPGNYSVTLNDKGYGIFLQRSIHLGNTASGAAANLTVTETGRHGLATSHEAVGVLVGDSEGGPVTLSAPGNITLSGWNVGVGSVLSNHHSSDYGPVTIAAGKNVSMTGNGTGSHGGNVTVEAGVASYGGTDHNNSILITAGGNISMTAPRVSIRGGIADANKDGGSSTDNATVTLKASGKVTLTGGTADSSGDAVDVSGGSAHAFAGDGGTANADAGVSISGNKGVTLHATHVNVNGGGAGVSASADAGTTAKATANAGIQIASKTGNINLTTGSAEIGVVQVRGGNAGFGNHVHAGNGSGEAATATATAHADVSLNAGGAINISANHVHVSGGYGAGAQSGSTIAVTHNVADADGPSANATFTATNGVNFTAGAGGIGITGGDSVTIVAGRNELNHASVTGQDGGHASAGGNGAVTFLTTGNLDITASNGSLRIHGGSSVAARSRVEGSNSGAAALNANGEVSLTAAAVTINAKNSSVRIEGGGSGEGSEGAAQLAAASGEGGGKASITGLADVAITAKTGGIAISAKQELTVRGGQDAAAGQDRYFTTSSGTSHFGPSSDSSTRNVHAHHPLPSYAFATADNSGATATLTGKAGVALTAKGALSLTQTGSSGGSRVSIGGGGNAGAIAHLDATGGATATLTGDAGITVKAASLKVTGKNVYVQGGGGAARGASTGYGSNYVLHRNSVGGTNHTSTSFTSTQPQVNRAGGANSKITLNGNSTVTLQAGTINLTALNGHLEVSGGYGAAGKQRLTASSGGSAAVNVNDGITITAKTAFTAAAKGSHGSLRIEAGGGIAGSHASVQALGSGNDVGSKAQVNGDSQVTITSPVVTLTAASVIALEGGFDNASNNANVIAAYGGSAGITANSALNITVAGKFTASLSGSANESGITIVGGGRGGEGARVFAHGSHAKAAINNTADVDITATAAGGVINISTGNRKGANLFVTGGSDTGYGAVVSASDSATATAKLSANVNLTAAAGNVTLNAKKGDLFIGQNENSYNNGRAVSVDAGYGAATFTASDNVNVNAINIKLNAGGYSTPSGSHSVTRAGNIDVQTGASRNAEDASVTAHSHGAASYTVNDQVSLKATGTLTMTAGANLNVGSDCCSHRIASHAKASAGGASADAALNLNESTLLQGNAAVSLTAGDDATLTTVSGPSGGSGGPSAAAAGAKASNKGTATYSNVGQLNIVTKGAFTVKAGEDLDIFGGLGARFGYASASGAGAKATNTTDGSVNVSASSVLLNAGSEISIAGGEGVAWDASAQARHGGVATLNANRSVNITAKTAITATLTGSDTEGEINIGNDSDAAVGAGARAFVPSHGGKATISANGTTNLNVTGTGGTITLSAGNHTKAEINVRSGTAGEFGLIGSSPRFAGAFAGVGGSASVNFLANTNFTAKGAITFDAGASGNLLIAPNGLDMADGHVAALGGKATANAQSAVNIAGGSVSFTAGNDITITAASLVAKGTGPSPSFFTDVNAQAGGTATMNVQTGVKITAVGAFTATAGSDLKFTANGNISDALTAASATVAASHGANATATLTATNTIQVNAATIALKATAGSLVIAGGSSGAIDAHVTAAARSEKATLNVDDSVNLTATGNITAKAGRQHHGTGSTATSDAGSITIAAGNSAGYGAVVGAGNHGVAALSVNAGVNIKAGGTLTLTAAGDLDVLGGNRVGPGAQAGSGGSAKATVNAGVSLTAVKSATLTAGSNVNIQAGGDVGHGNPGSLRGNGGGIVTETVNTSVSLQAGGNLTITAGNDVDILGGSSINLLPVDSYGGVVSVNVNTGVTVKTGGNLSLTATAGSIAVRGGGGVFYLADFTSVATGPGSAGTAGKSVKANLNTGVDVEAAGSATAVAGTNLLISAGDGALLAVGKFRNASGARTGTSWQGGSASITGNFSATFKAGKNLTLTAGKSGTGSLAIDALQGFGPSASIVNAVSVRGGSSHADAKFNVDGDALVQAGGNITVSVADNMGVYAGSFGDARIDHVNGSATMVATADATLKAGGNITFAKVGGDLTVAGIGVNSSHAGALVGEGAGLHDSGGSINVAVNANALISAGGSITTGKHAIGGDIAILAANDIVGFAVGPTAIVNTTINGNAGITGGGNVTLAATGNISVMGPGHVQASVASMATSGQYSMKVQGKTTVSAGGNLTLTAGGNLTVAGGDGVTVDITKASPGGNFVPVGFATGLASADVSANLHAGKAMSLNVGGNLWIRGGSDADAHVQVVGGFNSFNAHANADANVTAGTNLTIVAGSGATFQGGSNASATAWGIGSANKVTANGHADLNVTVGGNLTITATGPVNVFGGPLVEGLQAGSLAAVAVGNDNVASANGSAKVNITAAGNVAITAHGGNLTIAGASSAASFRKVLSGSSSGSQFANTAKVTADGSVSIKGKAVSLTATGGDVDIIAGRQGLQGGGSGLSSSAGPLSHANRAVIASGGTGGGSGNVASLIANSSVTITAATTLTITGTNVDLQAASAATTSGQLRTVTLATPGNTATAKQISGVNLTAPTIHITPPTTLPTSGSNFSSGGFQFSGGVVGAAALRGGTGNFGGVQVFSRGFNVLNSGQNTAVHTAPTAFVAPAITVGLGELQKLGLVTHLVTVLGDDSLALVPKTDAFSVSVEQRPSLLAPQATGFTPHADLGSGGASPAGER